VKWFILILASLAVIVSCDTSSPQKPVTSEYIYRKDAEKRLSTAPPERAVKKSYPWLQSNGLQNNAIPKITKEYFRCKGSSLNPARPHQIRGQPADPLNDCDGAEKHSLPLRGNQEFIYPILLEILNHIQTLTNKAVVITSGHRCPTHNTYVDPSARNIASKHTLGAEVDFYVRGFEEKPERVVEMVLDFYKKHPRYTDQQNFIEFKRFEKETDTTTAPWYNSEVFIKLYKSQEGRNFDNRHHYPYIAIQVRLDREKNLPVTYSWESAQKIYRR
jgi:hypothetical protein